MNTKQNSLGPNKDKLKIVKKYKYFSIIYDKLFIFLEKIVFFNDKNNPRQALINKLLDKQLDILDVCCGTGNDSMKIARKTENNIIGIDISPEMLELLDKKIKKNNITNISFHQMDATKMNFNDNTFDIVFSSFGFHEMDYSLMINVLKEIHRVLKHKGRLYIIDYGKEDNIFLRPIYFIYLKISYPDRVQKFLDYDWKDILESNDFCLDSIDRYTISNLICSTKI